LAKPKRFWKLGVRGIMAAVSTSQSLTNFPVLSIKKKTDTAHIVISLKNK
jgi:hypothetical protein